jgi:hypothetical protein
MQYLRETFPPPKKNTVGFSQKTLLFLYSTNSRLLTLFKVINAPVQVPENFNFTVSFKFISYIFQIFLLLFFLKWLLSKHLASFKLCVFPWFGSCNNCILACFFDVKFMNLLNQAWYMLLQFIQTKSVFSWGFDILHIVYRSPMYVLLTK